MTENIPFYLQMASGIIIMIVALLTAWRFKKTHKIEDEYIASMKRSLQYSEEYNKLAQHRINEIKAHILYQEFMRKYNK